MKEETDNNNNEMNEDSIFKSILVERDDEDGFVKLCKKITLMIQIYSSYLNFRC